MSVKTVRDLNATNRGQFDRAKTAAQSKNYDYSIALLQPLLKDEPLFLDGRKLLRTCAILKYKATGTLTRQMANMRIGTLAMKLATKKNPADQLVAAEEILAVDPYNYKANATVGEAGAALGSPEMKCFAFETLKDSKPEGDKSLLPILRNLAEAYMEAKLPEKASKTYDLIIEIDPRDGDALSGMKNAQAAMTHESWTDAEKKGDFREALKDVKESEQLEQQSKIVKSSDAIEDQIQFNYQKHLADPKNPVYPKTIASLYVQGNQFANAIPWYEAAFVLGESKDTSLEKTIGDLRIRAAEVEVRDLQDRLAQETDPAAQAAIQAEIETKETELNRVRLELAEARVRAQPNEGEFRYDLGVALFKSGQYKRATEELQQSLKQPSVRYQALNLLGLAFMKRGMLDFAINRLSLAESELPSMQENEIKKEVTYNLGLAYEANNDPVKALDQWKKIYEVDMTYRDVAARVEASYGGGGSS
jgi:tetratricopeptide (TPR) repeat protein